MSLDDDFLEREYNPRATIANFAALFAQWQARAQRARDSMPARLDLAYGAAAAEKLDYFPAATATATATAAAGAGAGAGAPLLVFIHGGYWRALDKADFSWIAPPYAAAGIAVAVLNYGLAPKTPLGEIVAQVRRAIAWIHAHAGELGADPARIFCSGHSAGGHLTAMLLATDWSAVSPALPRQPLAGALAISGLFDLEPLTRAEFLRQDLALDSSGARALSPAYLELKSPAPLLRAVGALESGEFHRQSALIAQRWPAVCGTPLLDVPGCNHLTVCDALASPGNPLFETVRSWSSAARTTHGRGPESR
jgi:arylformamidase